MKSSIHQNSQGFTLIELMATMVVGLILLVVGGVAYLRFQERHDAEKVATELQRFAVQTRAKARSQDAEGCTTGLNIKVIGYSLVFNGPANQVQSRGHCGSGKYDINPSESAVVSGYEINAPVDITFDGNLIVNSGVWGSTTNTISFYSLMGGATVDNDTDIEVSRGGVTYQFTISPGGEISAVTKLP